MCTQNQKTRREQHQDSLDQLAGLQEDLRSESPKVAEAIFLANYPDQTPSFFRRNYKYIVSLDPNQLALVIGYPDPTGEQAVNNILKEVAA
jgi:hypothetical protein